MKKTTKKKTSTKKATAKKAVTRKKVVSKSPKAKKQVSRAPQLQQIVPKEFTLYVDVNDETFKVEGDSVVECLNEIPKMTLKTKAVFVLEHGEQKTKQVMLFPFQAKRLFISKLNKEMFEKRMLSILK